MFDWVLGDGWFFYLFFECFGAQFILQLFMGFGLNGFCVFFRSERMVFVDWSFWCSCGRVVVHWVMDYGVLIVVSQFCWLVLCILFIVFVVGFVGFFSVGPASLRARGMAISNSARWVICGWLACCL